MRRRIQYMQLPKRERSEVSHSTSVVDLWVTCDFVSLLTVFDLQESFKVIN